MSSRKALGNIEELLCKCDERAELADTRQPKTSALRHVQLMVLMLAASFLVTLIAMLAVVTI